MGFVEDCKSSYSSNRSVCALQQYAVKWPIAVISSTHGLMNEMTPRNVNREFITRICFGIWSGRKIKSLFSVFPVPGGTASSSKWFLTFICRRALCSLQRLQYKFSVSSKKFIIICWRVDKSFDSTSIVISTTSLVKLFFFLEQAQINVSVYDGYLVNSQKWNGAICVYSDKVTQLWTIFKIFYWYLDLRSFSVKLNSDIISHTIFDELEI